MRYTVVSSYVAILATFLAIVPGTVKAQHFRGAQITLSASNLSKPADIAVDTFGNVFTVDQGNNRVLSCRATEARR